MSNTTHDGDAALLEYDGEPVAEVRWSYTGVLLNMCDGSDRHVYEDTPLTAGIAIVRAGELPGIIYGEWVSARTARFGAN